MTAKTIAMKIQISGTRNNEPWPAPGEPFDLDETEANNLIASGLAVESAYRGKAKEEAVAEVQRDTVHPSGPDKVKDEPVQVERATADLDAETRPSPLDEVAPRRTAPRKGSK